MPLPRPPRARLEGSDLFVAVGVAVLYVAAARLGLSLAQQAEQVSAVWPPAGLALAAVFWFGRRAAAGVFVGAFVANATAGEPLWVAAGIAVGNTLESVVGSALLRRFRFDPKIARPRDAFSLLGAAAISAAIAATIGVASLVAGKVQAAESFRALWIVWWLGDALGELVFAPLILVVLSRSPIAFRRGAFLEAPLLVAGLFAASSFAFAPKHPGADLKYLVFPFLIWAAVRFGAAATVVVTATMYAIAVWATHQGLGPFAGVGPEGGLVPLAVFTGVVAVTGLILGAIAAQRRAAEEASRVNERRLRLALSSARMGVWEWNLATGHVSWSGELQTVQGFTRGGFVGTFDDFRAIVHPDDRERVEREIRAAAENRRLYDAEFRVIGPDGAERWTGIRGQVVEDSRRRAARMVGVGINITRQKRLEEELRRRAELLAEADRRKDEFLAMLSHELRNPLAPILHAVEMLEHRDPALAAQARRMIRRQANHLARLVDDLLDVSRITRGTVRLERQLIPLGEVIESGIDVWRHRIAQRGQTLSVDVPEEPIWVDGDPTRLAQVVSNLLHNATNYTPQGGGIAIDARSDGGSAVIRMRDTGRGMSAHDLEHAFEPFARGPELRDMVQGGLGLGLTLARRLVELHGGMLEASSEGPGRGSEFVVRLPAAQAPAEARGGPAEPVAAPEAVALSGAHRRVLVVDDNEDAREALKFLLEDDGHEVRTAGDGPTAIAEAERFRPEVVLLDIGLPGIDGYEVARALRGIDHLRGAHIVAVSGYGQAEDRARSREAGFDLHMLKPVEPGKLLDLVRSV